MKKFKFLINGHKYEVNVEELEKNTAEVVVNGTHFTVEVEPEKKKTVEVMSPTIKRGAKKSAAPVAAPQKATSQVLKSELPGSIVNVMVKEGQQVKRGDVLLVIESMKMENNIMADADGTVKSVFVQAGQSVMQGDRLVEMEGVVSAASAPAAAPVAAPKASAPAAPVAAPVAASGAECVKSPLPGSVLSVAVSADQAVKRGDVLLVMESMKMENNIMAERDGVIKKVYIAAGQSVMQGDPLVDIE